MTDTCETGHLMRERQRHREGGRDHRQHLHHRFHLVQCRRGENGRSLRMTMRGQSKRLDRQPLKVRLLSLQNQVDRAQPIQMYRQVEDLPLRGHPWTMIRRTGTTFSEEDNIVRDHDQETAARAFLQARGHAIARYQEDRARETVLQRGLLRLTLTNYSRT